MKISVFLLFFIFLTGTVGYAQVITAPEIIKVSVDVQTGYTTIYWKKSTNPNVIFYRIAITRFTQGGSSVSHIIIPGSQVSSLIDNPSYTYKLADATKSSIGLSVRAYADENNSSPIQQTDSTLFIQASFDSCQSTIHLYWNDYNSWRGKIDHYTLYHSIDNSHWTPLATYAEGVQTHTLTDVQPNRNYRFFVAAIRNNAQYDSSSSNSTLVKTSMSLEPDYLVMNSTNYAKGGQEVSFSIDPLSQMKSYNLMRSTNPNGPFDSLTTFDNSDKERTYYDNADFFQGPYYYRLVAINHCKLPVKNSINLTSTIVLTAQQQEQQIELNWNHYLNYTGSALPYIVERKQGNGPFQEIVQTSSTHFTDSDFTNAGESDFSAEICYRITAPEGSGNPTGQQNQSYSNEACKVLNPNIRFDYDAFIPDDANGNNRFGPEFDFTPVNFRFRIFDRAGVVVFESTDPFNAHWNGRHNNSFVPEAAYMYVLDYTGPDGKDDQLTGTVTVVYQR